MRKLLFMLVLLTGWALAQPGIVTHLRVDPMPQPVPLPGPTTQLDALECGPDDPNIPEFLVLVRSCYAVAGVSLDDLVWELTQALLEAGYTLFSEKVVDERGMVFLFQAWKHDQMPDFGDLLFVSYLRESQGQTVFEVSALFDAP